MYKSKRAIRKKLQQVKYSQNLIRQFQGVLLAENGIDSKTGAHPLMVHLSAFLSQARSVLQYAHKEAKETGQLAEYEQFINQSKIIKFFKRIRDCDIHEYPIGVHTTIHATVYMAPVDNLHPIEGLPETTPLQLNSELKDDGNTQPDVKLIYTICERVETTESLLRELEKTAQDNLLQAARSGIPLYAELEFEGNKDLHEICGLYVTELENFISFGESKGFIS
ncbi:MAG: hypothetical protein U0319_03375 [Nitrospira sp.]